MPPHLLTRRNAVAREALCRRGDAFIRGKHSLAASSESTGGSDKINHAHSIAVRVCGRRLWESGLGAVSCQGMSHDFVAIGDTAVDEFIRLKDASVHCDVDTSACTITMRWGDKIPYEFAETVAGVGNAANAAVAAARLGLESAFVSNVGADENGKKILEVFTQEGVDTAFVAVHKDLPTNHHYVLWYESERTILIRHENYPYALPQDFPAPKWVYLSSAGERSADFHTELATWLSAHPETKLAFQPGTFQISMGKEKLAALYARTEVFACNKEEAARILGIESKDPKELFAAMHALGPKIVIITDGRNGVYASDNAHAFSVPMYPDEKPPVDRTGAGDAAASTTVVALALGLPLQDAVRWGLVNSASVVQEVGAQKGLLSRTDIEQRLASAPASFVPTPL